MLSLSVHVAVVAMMVAMVVVADPGYPYKPCYAHTVTVTKVETSTKEVPTYKTLLERKTETSTTTKTNTVTVLGHHGHGHKYGR